MLWKQRDAAGFPERARVGLMNACRRVVARVRVRAENSRGLSQHLYH